MADETSGLRPRRAAALSARAAITALASDNQEHDDVSPDDESQVKSKRAKLYHSAEPNSSKDTVLIPNPAPVDLLPIELRLEVLSYFDHDPYTILNTLLVSKTWYLTLMHGPHAEKAWMRRCQLLGAKRKSPRCNWHQTFIQLLHKRCISCFEPAKLPIGSYLFYGFTFIKACNSCWYKSDNVYMVALSKLVQETELHIADLRRCPIFHRQVQPDLWQLSSRARLYTYGSSGYILNVAVNQLRLKVEESRAYAKQIMNSVGLDEGLYDAAVLYSREGQIPRYPSLDLAIAHVKGSSAPTFEDFAAVINAHQAVTSLVRAIEEAFQQLENEEERDVTCHSNLNTVHASPAWLSEEWWICALLNGSKQIHQYVEATVLKRAQERKKEKKKEQELARHLRRSEMAKTMGRRGCAVISCDNSPASACISRCCARCCSEDDCKRHRKVTKVI